MPNDAKLGLVVGVSLVVAVAVLFFRKDLATAARPVAEAGSTVEVRPLGTALPALPLSPSAPAPVQIAGQTKPSTAPQPQVRYHTVAEGDTLYTLAQRYYGDGDRFADLFRANRKALSTPDALPPGTVLVIPDLGR